MVCVFMFKGRQDTSYLGAFSLVAARRPGPIPVYPAILSVKDMHLDTSPPLEVMANKMLQMHAPSSQEELTNAELGLVMSPPQIVQRIEHGAYLIRYLVPEFSLHKWLFQSRLRAPPWAVNE